jgi:hypothetical protein
MSRIVADIQSFPMTINAAVVARNNHFIEMHVGEAIRVYSKDNTAGDLGTGRMTLRDQSGRAGDGGARLDTRRQTQNTQAPGLSVVPGVWTVLRPTQTQDAAFFSWHAHVRNFPFVDPLQHRPVVH